MGRSVATPRNAVWTEFFPFECGEPDFASEDWDNLTDGLVESLTAAFPSLSAPYRPRYLGNELRVLLSNRHGDIVIAEYCGLCSLSFVATDGDGEALAQNWGELIRDRVRKLLPQRLVCIGTASNGEAFFRLAA